MRAHKMVVMIGLVAGVGYGQTEVIFSITGPAPLAQAAEKFEMLYGIPVSYEDATYVWDGDLDDHTDPGYARSHPVGSRALDPKGGSLVLRANPLMRPIHSASDAMPLLQSLVDDHGKAEYPGQFKLITNGDGVDIVPVAVKDVSGILVPDQSLLETRISLPELKRTGDQMLNEICQAIRANTGKNIGVGSNDFRSLYYSATIGADNEVARSVLERTLSGLQSVGGQNTPIPKAAWSLRYSPGLKIYLLNVRQVRVEVHTPAGGKMKRPVFR